MSHWLPIRAKFLTELNRFVFKDFIKARKECDDEDEKENKQESQRYMEKLSICVNYLHERVQIDFSSLETVDFHEELKSLTGETLEGDKEKFLNSRQLGIQEVFRFVQERLVEKEKDISAPIKKMCIPVFPYLDSDKKAKKIKPVNERKELQTTGKLLKIITERGKVKAADMGKLQVTSFHGLVDTSQRDVQPNVRTNKSKAMR